MNPETLDIVKADAADDDVDADPALEAAVRGRLTAMAAAAVVAPGAWEDLRSRTAAVPSVRGRARARRRLLAVAAVLLLLVGSAVADTPDGGDDRVDTDDRTSTADHDGGDGDGDDHPDDEGRDDSGTEDDGAEQQPPTPDTGGDASPVHPGAAPSGGDGGVASPAPVPAGGTGAGSPGTGGTADPAPAPPAPPVPTTPTPTTTPPPPPPRSAGDITVATASGFDVELVLEEVAGRISAIVRRTDSDYDGSIATRTMVSDGYGFSTGIVEAGGTPSLGARCIRWGSTAHQTLAPHAFAFGMVGADVAAVRVLLPSGESVPARMTTRSVANGVRAYLTEVPAHDINGVEAYDAAGALVVSAAPPDSYLCGS